MQYTYANMTCCFTTYLFKMQFEMYVYIIIYNDCVYLCAFFLSQYGWVLLHSDTRHSFQKLSGIVCMYACVYIVYMYV